MESTTMRGPIDCFAEDMKKMVDNQEMSDVVFHVGKDHTPICGHRMHLSARCRILKAKIAEANEKRSRNDVTAVTREDLVPGAHPTVVTLEDMIPDIFRAVLEFIYTNCVTLHDNNAIDVLKYSIKFDLVKLTELCNSYLIDNLKVENACDVVLAAIELQQEELGKRALKFIEDRTVETFKTEAFHNLTSEVLCIILESDNLDIDEMDVIEAVREWADVNKVLLNKSVQEVTREVTARLRLPLLDDEELVEVEKQCEEDKLISDSHIKVAWKCHAQKLKPPNNRSLITCRKGTKYRDHHDRYNLFHPVAK